MSNYTIAFRAMGSGIQVWLNVPDARQSRILAQAPRWFEEWEEIFSRFRLSSELTRLNAGRGYWVTVSQPLYEVVESALQLAAATDGIFNPLVLPALEAAGYDHSFEPQNFTPRRHQPAVAVPDWRSVRLDPTRRAICLPPAGRLDLGGIAKGWAAEAAAERLSAHGPCLIDAGGDLVARGSPDETGGWLAGIPDQEEKAERHTVLLSNETLATSGTDYRRWQHKGRSMHHLIDPRTGQPAASPVVRSTVIAPDAVRAVVWAKVGLIAGEFPDLPTEFLFHDGVYAANARFEQRCLQRVNAA